MGLAKVELKHTLGRAVFRRCSCGHGAFKNPQDAGHSINPFDAVRLPCDEPGCGCASYDGAIEPLEDVALKETT